MENNPWLVGNLEEFLFFCCPECDNKSSTKAAFINHALVEHPKAREIIPVLEVNQDIKNEDFEDIADSKSDEDLKDSIVQCYNCCELMPKDKIEKHIRSEHGTFSTLMFGAERPYQCTNCQCALLKDPSEDQHVCKPYFVKKSNKKDPVQCTICNREFKKQATLFTHLATAHSEERNFACTYCDFKAKISVVLNRHIKRKHFNELNYVCELCGKKFFEAYRLRLHEASHSKSRKKRQANSTQNLCELPCDICAKTFLGQQALNVHKTVSHGVQNENENKKKSLTCDKCGKSFSNANGLHEHYNQEHPSLDKLSSLECNCDFCGSAFEDSLTLNNHLVACEASKELKHFSCDKCPSSSSMNWHSAKALKKHIAESHGLVLTICDICGCCLKSKYYLEDHKKIVHQGLKSHSCDYCGKVFASRSTLNGHVGRMHETLARKFKCDKCDFSCLEPNKLKIHDDAVHVKSIKYQCHMCKYFSFRKTGLQNHIKVVHEKYRPHKCDQCEQTFTYKRDKIKHMLKHS